MYETADGREIRMDFVRVYIEFMGNLTVGCVIIGDEGVGPLLGVTALESTGIEVDPVNQMSPPPTHEESYHDFTSSLLEAPQTPVLRNIGEAVAEV